MTTGEDFKGFLYHFEKTAETFLSSLEQVKAHLLDLDKRLSVVERQVQTAEDGDDGNKKEVKDLEKSLTKIDKEFSNFKTQILVYITLGGLIFGTAVTALVTWAVSSLLKHGG